MAGGRSDDARLVEEIAAITGLRIDNVARLRAALTHSSARRAGSPDYERLEFLGDRVLGLVIAELVFSANPEASEGEMSLRLNALVNADILAEIAAETGLDRLIRTGSGTGATASRKQVNLRADALEALIAVVYLEGGLEAARAFVRSHWEPRSLTVDAARRDAKTALQEWAHQAAGTTPAYSVDGRTGPDHDPVFTVSVAVPGREPATGRGRSKREAEQAAATAMLEREAVWNQGEGVS